MKKILFTTALLYANSATAMFCPGSLNQINIGDSIEQVVLLCGKPQSQVDYVAKPPIPQEWNYFIALAQNMPGMQNMKGTVKVVVTFDKQKVVNITSNGIGVSSTQICGKTLTLNQTPKQVEAACGKPTTVIESDAKEVQEEQKKGTPVSEFKYGGDSPVLLIFENAKLKERRVLKRGGGPTN